MIKNILAPLLLLLSVIILAEVQARTPAIDKQFLVMDQIPGNIPDANSTIRTFFGNFNRLMIYIANKSNIVFLENGCREYQFYNGDFMGPRKNLRICIERDVTPDSITERVHYYINDKSYGINTLVKAGPKVSATDDEDLFMYNFPNIKQNMDYEISMEPDGLKWNLSTGLTLDKMFLSFPFFNFQMNIEERRSEESQVRSYRITCETFCEGNVSEIRVHARKIDSRWGESELSFHADGIGGEITPRLFFELVGSLIFRPLGQLIDGLKSTQREHGWPVEPRPNQ